MKHICWNSICTEKERYHIARTHITGRSIAGIHTQDYAEIFWIERGTGTHQINGRKVTLREGDLVWVRQTDTHGFRTLPGTDGFVLTNLAFSQETVEHLASRYFPDELQYFWTKDKLPFCQRVSPVELKRLTVWTAFLDRGPRTQFEVDRFLMDLIHRSRDSMSSPAKAALPEWLKLGLKKFEESGRWAEGVAGLAAVCGRTPEHINATFKSTLGLTSTQMINKARMDFAASQLRISTKKILEICFDSGFGNLGHFYKVFHEHHGISPRHYRLRHLTALEG